MELLQGCNHTGFANLACSTEMLIRFDEVDPDESVLLSKRVFRDHINGNSRICNHHRERLGFRFRDYYKSDCNYPLHIGGRRCKPDYLRAMKNEEARYLYIKFGLFIPISSKESISLKASFNFNTNVKNRLILSALSSNRIIT